MKTSVKKFVTPYGLALGAALSTLTLLAYTIQLDWFTSSWFSPLKLIIVFTLALIGVYQTRRQKNSLSFREAFTAYFVVVVIGTALYTVVSYFLFDLIDRNAASYITEKSIEKFHHFATNNGLDPDKIKQQITILRHEDQFSLLNQFKGFVFNLVIYCLAGLLVALFFKSKKPIRR